VPPLSHHVRTSEHGGAARAARLPGSHEDFRQHHRRSQQLHRVRALSCPTWPSLAVVRSPSGAGAGAIFPAIQHDRQSTTASRWGTAGAFTRCRPRLIADSVEYMVNAHCADALMLSVSNCDKIRRHADAAMRLNIPTGVRPPRPDESGRGSGGGQPPSPRGIPGVVPPGETGPQARPDRLDGRGGGPVGFGRRSSPPSKAALPALWVCSGMFTANSMNCLTEATGPRSRALGGKEGGVGAGGRGGVGLVG